MLSNGQVHVDPNNVPLASFVAQEEQVDVNFVKNNFSNNAYRNNFVIIIINLILQIMVILMAILMVIFTTIIEVCPLIMKACLKIFSLHKRLLIKLLRKKT